MTKGLIFTASGTAMTAAATKKGKKLYRYYTSMDLIRNRQVPEGTGPARLPAAMVDGAVIAEMRRLISAPEVVARVMTACRADGGPVDERAIVEALHRFNDLWDALFPAEQARRLLVHRVTIGAGGIAVDLRNQGLASLVRDLTANITREAAE